MNRKGQIRIVEAITACALILIGHFFLSSYTSSMTTTKAVELEILVQNLLNSVGDQDVLFDIVEEEESASYALKELIQSILPPDILFNVSLASLVSNEVLANATNMSSMTIGSQGDVVSMQGMNTVTLPIQTRKEVLLDIELLIDRSQSMGYTLTGDEQSKIDYARQAACVFIDLMDNSTDRIGCIFYHTTDNIEEHLSNDTESLKDFITSHHPVAGQTNITRGLQAANSEFNTTGRGNASKYIILLTDGKEPIREYAIAQAEIAKSNGIRIYTIGLGDKTDIDKELMEQIQSDGYFYAPSGRDLESIYKLIARELTLLVKYDIVLITITLLKT